MSLRNPLWRRACAADLVVKDQVAKIPSATPRNVGREIFTMEDQEVTEATSRLPNENVENPGETEEEWRDIPGFPSYQASSLGRIRSADRMLAIAPSRRSAAHMRPMKGNILCPWRAGDYWVVSLGKVRKRGVHRLVCLAFHGRPPSPKHETAHNDGNPTRNVPSNLRWATKIENEADKVVHGTISKGPGLKGYHHPRAKLTDEAVREIRAGTVPARYLAGKLGVHASTINRIRSGSAWR